MNEGKQVIGRVKAVFVSQDDSEKGVISAIVARRAERQEGGRRLRFLGTVKFTGPVRKHVRATILPIIDRIVDTLGLSRKNFEISAVNLGVASAQDVGITVSGFSADVPAFIAMLSQSLQIPVNDNFVSTGHIASVEGDIRPVKGIPAKAKAAKNDSSIRWFIQPNFEKDESLKALFPDQRDRSIEAIDPGEDLLYSKEISNIGQLIRLVFTEENIILASLRENFYGISKVPNQFDNPVHDVVSLLTESNQKRFCDILQHYFIGDPHKKIEVQCEKGKELLRAFAQFYIRRQEYPSGFGAMLFQLIRSVHLALRKLKIDFPILDQGLCNDLITFAGDADYDDILLLVDAVRGRNIANTKAINIQPEIQVSDSESMVFDAIVSMINEQALAEKFGIIENRHLPRSSA